MEHILFYTKQNCPLCDHARALLDLLRHDYSFRIEERDIYEKDEWLEEYQLLIPTVKIGDAELHCEEISYEALKRALKNKTEM
ncbi:glutaredoxin family protein [Lentibacillus cibarius]|uniref:Glutaredoxin family protein n=1 Tax=Lentibacillus cibarius TaxID=2583219 RepID=A0A5S3QHE2_9BACI|nr:glutaredoxin family protein [Lentibacillus cibarius]TMN21314.1 glutaredoxin family protein [Lentibacillus cibarius]